MKQILKKLIIIVLEWEAKLVLRKYRPRIIAITGSVGKTSTKDAIYSVLAPSFHVRKSEKSFNSEIGVPLTILGIPNAWSSLSGWIRNILDGAGLVLFSNDYPRLLVLEVGTDRPGDIEHIASWLKPDVVVLTRFPDVPVHVEFFESPEHVIKEKLHLVRALKKDGALIINFDDEKMRDISPPREGSLLTYGFMDGADLHAKRIEYRYDREGNASGLLLDVQYRESSVEVELRGALGHQQAYVLLAAFALGISEGLNLEDMKIALQAHTPPPGRMRTLPGVNNSLIIDDSYNASPIAVEEALNTLINVITRGRRIAVLGDMLELGNYSVPAHRNVGEKVAECADVFVAVGIRSKYSAEAAERKKMKKRVIFTFNEAEEAGRFLQQYVAEGDVVLVKGSQSIRMERVVKSLMSESEKASELLVRQDSVWLAKP